MGRVTHAVPAKNPREIFSVAECFFISSGILSKAKNPDGKAHEFRTIAPTLSLYAFSLELYLKCLLVLSGSTSVPATHDISELFRNLPKNTRIRIERYWSKLMIKLGEDVIKRLMRWSKSSTLTLESAISNCSNYFEEWRYLFEMPKTGVTVELAMLAVIVMIRSFILGLEPEWENDAEDFHVSTFPFQKGRA